MSIYAHRDGWQTRVTVNGQKRSKNFGPNEKTAARNREAKVRTERLKARTPLLGGPGKITLARGLYEYAHLYSIKKKGLAQELTKLNPYLSAAKLPTLKAEPIETGGIQRVERTPTALPATFASLREQRAKARAQSRTWREKLARKTISDITASDLVQLSTAMTRDGLTDSSVQKELSLLKHFFHCARVGWNRAGFESPMDGVKVLTGGPGRNVVLTDEAEARPVEELLKCDNPFIRPYVQFATETTSRRWQHAPASLKRCRPGRAGRYPVANESRRQSRMSADAAGHRKPGEPGSTSYS